MTEAIYTPSNPYMIPPPAPSKVHSDSSSDYSDSGDETSDNHIPVFCPTCFQTTSVPLIFPRWYPPIPVKNNVNWILLAVIGIQSVVVYLSMGSLRGEF